MSFFQRLFAPKADPRDALRPLWAAVVAEARRPAWYAEARVADTVAGRFDMVCAVLAATLVRMETAHGTGDPPIRESVLLTELFVHDMDGQLREMGAGDVVVGKRIGKLVSAMGGRLDAYRAGLAADDAVLAEAVRRNVTFADDGDAPAVARGLRAWAGRLARTDDDALVGGSIAP